jgi:uncharacterized protein (DUF302 family)
MKKIIATLALSGAFMLTSAAPPGVVTVPSTYDASETVARLTDAAKAKNLLVFATINFARDAATIGLSMNDAQLLIVGNPRGGTPAMQAVPLAALDLPLKILVWSDANSKVWVSYNAPEYLQGRYGLSDELAKPLSGIGPLVAGALKPD